MAPDGGADQPSTGRGAELGSGPEKPSITAPISGGHPGRPRPSWIGSKVCRAMTAAGSADERPRAACGDGYCVSWHGETNRASSLNRQPVHRLVVGVGRVARREHGTGLSGFLPPSWDHLGCQSWDYRRVVRRKGQGLPPLVTSCRVTWRSLTSTPAAAARSPTSTDESPTARTAATVAARRVLSTRGFAIYRASSRTTRTRSRPAARSSAERSPRSRLRPLPRRPKRLDHTPDELVGQTIAERRPAAHDRRGRRASRSGTGRPRSEEGGKELPSHSRVHASPGEGVAHELAVSFQSVSSGSGREPTVGWRSS